MGGLVGWVSFRIDVGESLLIEFVDDGGEVVWLGRFNIALLQFDTLSDSFQLLTDQVVGRLILKGLVRQQVDVALLILITKLVIQLPVVDRRPHRMQIHLMIVID